MRIWGFLRHTLSKTMGYSMKNIIHWSKICTREKNYIHSTENRAYEIVDKSGGGKIGEVSTSEIIMMSY